jgi:thiol-disulfide isomerase/thioredoxin
MKLETYLGFGLVIVLALGAGLYFILPHTPGNSGGILNQLTASTASSSPTITLLTAAQKAAEYQKAPEIVGADGYLNTNGQPITIGQFKGNSVVLIDFWTYSCINCQRTFPYLKAWWAKYQNEGLEIIGIETPEFAFEKVQSNVAAALKQFGLTYPIVQDNNYDTWNAFGNEYWPSDYLVDIDSYIVYQNNGEGDYDKTEEAIQAALAEKYLRAGATSTAQSILESGLVNPADAVSVDATELGSPETYFGSNRNEYLGNGAQAETGVQNLTIPSSLEPNTLYLGGSWNITPEYAEASAGATIEFEYQAKSLYFVAGGNSSATIEVLRDGVPLGTVSGADVSKTDSTATISAERLYDLIDDTGYGVHTIEIKVLKGTLDAYTFTFG